MNRLTKFTLAASAAFTLGSASIFASAGIYGTALVVSGSTALDGLSTILYEANLGGGLDYAPQSPTQSNITYDSSGDLAAGTVSLGTYNIATGDTLTLDGGEVLTYKSGSDNFTNADLYYSLNGGSSFTDLGLAFNQDGVNYANSDDHQRWYTDNANVNLLNGLQNGTYYLTVYLQATDNYGSGTYVPVDNNGGGNYTASFTVVPEPATLSMMLASGIFGSFYLIRRRRK